MTKLERVIIHWTGGAYIISPVDRQHYHYIVDNEGRVHNGNCKPEDNLTTNDNVYAAHTHLMNSGSIGVAMAGMAGFNTKDKKTNWPLTQKQFEACCSLAARLCEKYSIAVTPKTVRTHFEVGLEMRNSKNAGKIDIMYLPFKPELQPEQIGNYIRNKVQWYLEKEKK